jgi:DNA-binding protein HU-beta
MSIHRAFCSIENINYLPFLRLKTRISRLIGGLQPMNKTELVSAVAEKADLTKANAQIAVEAVIDSIIDALSEQDKVQLVGFGTFAVADRKERKSQNPQTKEPLLIPAHQVPVFRPSSALKEKVQKEVEPVKKGKSKK